MSYGLWCSKVLQSRSVRTIRERGVLETDTDKGIHIAHHDAFGRARKSCPTGTAIAPEIAARIGPLTILDRVSVLGATAGATTKPIHIDCTAIAIVAGEALGTSTSGVVNYLLLDTDIGSVAVTIHAMAATGGGSIADRRSGE